LTDEIAAVKIAAAPAHRGVALRQRASSATHRADASGSWICEIGEKTSIPFGEGNPRELARRRFLLQSNCQRLATRAHHAGAALMQIQLIGHASLLITTADCRILVDPVFFDPHAEGIEEIYPRRNVSLADLPEFDLMVISHRHPDHFDIPTLSFLPRDVGVFIPEDALMRGCLEQLGYSRVRPLGTFKEVSLGQSRLTATASDSRIPEFGILFADETGVLWNQVDSVINAKIIETVLARYGTIDLMLAMWQPMLELNYQINRSLEFPYEAYGDLLSSISMIRPRALIPGANGFCYHGVSSWLNRIVFPVTRERFCEDVVGACPALRHRVVTLDPGEAVRLEDGETSRIAAAAPFVHRLDRSYEPYRFAPVCIDDHFVDANPDGHDIEQMMGEICREIEIALPEFIRSEPAAFMSYRQWDVVYQLEVAFPHERRTWLIVFSAERIRAVSGRSPLANLFSYITSSALFSIMKRTKGWDYALLGGFYRIFQKIYKITPYGLSKPTSVQFQDPLALLLDYETVLKETLQHQINQQLRPHSCAAKAEQPFGSGDR
jgi:UDP-MurNAc hydroxylase